MYEPFGVVENPGAELLPPSDKGRFTVTKSGQRRVRVQGAHVAEHRADRTVPSHRAVVGFASGRGCHGREPIGAQLTAEETEKIVAFFDALTGEQPTIVHPILPPSVSETPRPQP